MTVLNTHVDLISGDDYKLADQRALLWECGDWPNLAGASLALVVGYGPPSVYGSLPLTWTGTMAPVPNPTQRAILELTAAESGALAPGEYDYSLSAVLVDGNRVTLALGKVSATASPGFLAVPPA